MVLADGEDVESRCGVRTYLKRRVEMGRGNLAHQAV